VRLAEFATALRQTLRGSPVVVEEFAVQHRSQSYPFFHFASPADDTAADAPVLLLTAGLHGDERAGPITLVRHAPAILERAQQSGLRLSVYPLVNPSGFDNNTRYNADGDRGEEGNNDFLRYQLEDGSWRGDLGSGGDFRRWAWSCDPLLGARLPQETALLHTLLRQQPLDRLVAALDLHQDCITPTDHPFAYHYAFGDLGRYVPIVRQVETLLPVARLRAIGAGQQFAMKTDKNGFLVRHDGTLTDLFHRLGARHSVAVETTGDTPLDVACEVNLLWVEGLIELVANGEWGS